MLTATEIRKLLDLTRAQFERLLEQAGERLPEPRRAGTTRVWSKGDLDVFQHLVFEGERVGTIKK